MKSQFVEMPLLIAFIYIFYHALTCDKLERAQILNKLMATCDLMAM
jgi:hypothetical protein